MKLIVLNYYYLLKDKSFELKLVQSCKNVEKQIAEKKYFG